MRRLIRNGLATLIALPLLLWPLLHNGSPILFHDSFVYLGGGGTALDVVAGLETQFSQDFRAPPDAGGESSGTSAPDAGSGSQAEDRGGADRAGADAAPQGKMVSAARSVYYSAGIVLVFVVAGLAGIAVVQTLVSTLAVERVWSLWRPDDAAGYLAALALLAVLTPFAFFNVTILPDFLAPLCILGMACLFAGGDRLGPVDRLIWLAILAAAGLSHTVHLATAVLLLPVGVLAALLLAGRGLGKAVLVSVAAIAVSVGGIVAFQQAVKSAYGYAPLPLPMIAASVITDGPGADYLDATCPENGYVYCGVDYRRAQNVDAFLWSGDPETGVYLAASNAVKRQMSEQQVGLLLDTLMHDPSGQVLASLGRAAWQAVHVSLMHLEYDYTHRRNIERLFPPDQAAALRETEMYAEPFPLAGLSALYAGTALAGLVGIALALRGIGRIAFGRAVAPERRERARALLAFFAMVLAGVLINAALTGVASQPQGRYQARVIWLLPFLAVLGWLWLRGERTRAG